MTGALHEERLQAVQAALLRTRAARVLDLGCGDGDLLVRLAADARFNRLVGVDIDHAALGRLRARLGALDVRAGHVELRHGSMADPAPDLAGYDCALLVETIEHIDPARLSALERALFARMRPRHAIVTTPNAAFNTLLGVPPHRFRHPDHRFEWDRAAFRRWAGRVGGTGGYTVTFEDIAGCHPDLGGASQMAVFTRAAER